jgi:hypothetical protein
MERRRIARYVAAGAAAAACAVVPAAAARTDSMAPARIDTRTMVLQPQDLPSGFGHASGKYVSNADLARQADNSKDYNRLGRLTGYDVSYQRRAMTGVLGLDSFASLYRSNAGAHASFVQSMTGAHRTGTTFRPIRVRAAIGSEMRVYLVTTSQGGVRLDFYTVAWRHGPVFAEVIGGGISGTVAPLQLVALAKKQEARIRAALA